MRVAVIVVLMLVRATPSEASTSCMTKTEARQHFGSVLAWPGALLGRDTGASPWGSPPRAPSRARADAALRGPDTIARPAQIGERDGQR